MKRIVVSVLVLVLLAAGCSSMAENGRPYADMPDDQLIIVWNLMSEELYTRGYDFVTDGYPGGTHDDHVSWYDYGLGYRLPNPSKVIGRTLESDRSMAGFSDTQFMEIVQGVTEDEFRKYAEVCRQWGYTEDAYWAGDMYTGSTEDGVTVEVLLYDGEMMVAAYKK